MIFCTPCSMLEDQIKELDNLVMNSDINLFLIND